MAAREDLQKADGVRASLDHLRDQDEVGGKDATVAPFLQQPNLTGMRHTKATVAPLFHRPR